MTQTWSNVKHVKDGIPLLLHENQNRKRDIPKVWKCGYCTQQQLDIQPEKLIKFQSKFLQLRDSE